MSLPDLAAVLWRQRELMEQLAYKLECEQLLMVSGRTGRLGHAVTDIEVLVGQLQVLELQRAEAADRAAAEAGLLPGSSLAELAVTAGPPWSQVLLDHRTALTALSEELRLLGESTRKLAGGGFDAIQLALREVGLTSETPSGGYNADGQLDSGLPGLHMAIDRVM